MLVFASPLPAAFAGIDALHPRSAPRQSTEEQYFSALAEEHERAAAFARQRLQEVRHRQQQHDLEAKLRLQQQLAASLQARTPMRSPYQPRTRLGRTLPDVLFEFDAEGRDPSDDYAELVHRRSQAAMLERQKRAEEQAILRALFEEQRRTEAERVAELHRQRAEQAKAERERIVRAQHERAQMAEREQAHQHLAARAAEDEKLKAFFEALVSAMNAEKEEGAGLERKNAVRRSSVPIPVPVETPAPTAAPASTPSPANVPAPASVPRAASPSPSVASDTSEASLHSISHLQDKYDSLRSSFEFPATLSFAPSTNSPASAPTLLFNPTNAPLHAYEHALTGLLTELDAVESFGDDHVRDVRRSLVRRIESELESLEEKKREMWRGQSEPVPVESVIVAVESPSVTVESPAPALVEVESTSAPTESAAAPAESTATPAPVPALPTTIDPANPLAWLAARLAQPSESEDSEVKAVREGLAARLTESVVESSPPVVVEQPESLAAESSGDVAIEQPEAVALEESESPIVDEPESLESSEITITARSPTPAAEPQPEPEAIEVTVETETHTSTELASPTPAPASVLVAEPESLAEPEQLAHETETEPEVQCPTTTTTESIVAESESGSEPEVVAAPGHESEPTEPETAKFVQVFPDSDSDVDTDVDEDLVSELADRKSTSGADEFEML